MAEASEYYERTALEQADDERSFDLAATGVLQELAHTVTHAAELLPQDEHGESCPWTRGQAVLAALVVRCSKLLRAYAYHFEHRQLEICYLARGLVETTTRPPPSPTFGRSQPAPSRCSPLKWQAST